MKFTIILKPLVKNVISERSQHPPTSQDKRTVLEYSFAGALFVAPHICERAATQAHRNISRHTINIMGYEREKPLRARTIELGNKRDAMELEMNTIVSNLTVRLHTSVHPQTCPATCLGVCVCS